MNTNRKIESCEDIVVLITSF